jgi:hypothetical protein
VVAALAVSGLSACTTEGSVNAGPPSTSASAEASTVTPPAATGPVPPLPEVGDVPVEHDAGYADAVSAFGADQVTAALIADAQIAHIALADCHRWTTGEVDPRLTALVAPELLARALDELAVSKEYGGSPVPSLLSHLPEDDGNGVNEAAAVAGGCDDSAPLRFPSGSARVRVDNGGDHPRLQITGGYVTDVVFGATRVGAGQDWEFTSERAADGWLMSDASVSGNVDWFPAPAQTATS